ncbi:MAG TPA: hypothetical protein DCQ20_02625 [Nitrospira sp.]|nr:hypothetical protein [Nitrospira sp.]
MKVPALLEERRKKTKDRLTKLAEELGAVGASAIVDKRACVYATGSVGRGEMSDKSDLDVFIVRDHSLPSPLTNLEEIRLKARLIEVSRKLEFPEFSDDGEYVKTYDVKKDMLEKLGTKHDDYENVFTARLLLLLESRPVVGLDIYDRTIQDLIAAYWRDYPQNSAIFQPVFLMNDILRFWKTLCLNYEERTSGAKAGKRRLLNYKLKHSRLLTCYSAIVYLLTAFRAESGTISDQVARQMVEASPTQRLEYVASQRPETAALVQRILDNYAKFLGTCDEEKKALTEKFTESEFKKARFAEARDFGNDVFGLVMQLGKDSDLLRYLVV